MSHTYKEVIVHPEGVNFKNNDQLTVQYARVAVSRNVIQGPVRSTTVKPAYFGDADHFGKNDGIKVYTQVKPSCELSQY